MPVDEVTMADVCSRLDDVSRLLVLMLRADGASQSDLVVQMSRSGLPNPRIAELTGVDGDVVRATVNKAKARAIKK